MNDDLIHIIALKDNRIYDLQKALEWYADKANYDPIEDYTEPYATPQFENPAIWLDLGENARTALQSIQGGDAQ
jgi:hypothetical protein